MSKFTKLVPVLAIAVAFSPLAAHAFSQHGARNAAYAGTAIASQVAANSKGRPGEFATDNQLAANSKGRPAEFNQAGANETAANSKGRPAEFTPAAATQLALNSKGRPGEYANPVQLADNSKGRPGEFSTQQYETPIG